PAWDLFPLENYISRHQVNGVNIGRSMPLLATRGCPYQCAFCSNPFMWTQRWVPRAPKLVVDEIESYIAKYRVTNFDFQDLTAVVKRRWIIEFCNELMARDLNITWQMPSGTRAETFDDEVAQVLRASGCRALAFAPESGSVEMLEEVKKKVDLDKMIESVRTALRHDLTLSCFFVIGFPNETETTMAQTLKLIRRLAVLGVHDISAAKFVPYPGSELFRSLQQNGKIELDDAFFESPMDFYTTEAPSYADAVSTRRLFFMMNWMFVNFYVISFLVRPHRVARVLFNAIVFGREETRYSKWFVDRFYTRPRWRKMKQAQSAA
ncbi:MAG: radical SAM protein, partial [Rhodospirillaceae bacterium]|nr:radical SAM protein [Rhodospirillaceae bacterium]